MAKKEKMQEFTFNNVGGEVFFGCVIFGVILAMLIDYLGSFKLLGAHESNEMTAALIGGIVGACCAIWYCVKLYKFGKQFKIKPDNPYSIDAVIDYFGDPDKVIKDKDGNDNYFFTEIFLGFGERTHQFVVNNKKIVIKHLVGDAGFKEKSEN